MTDFPQPNVEAPPFLHTWSRYSAVWEYRMMVLAMAAVGTVDPTADTIIYTPMSIPWPYICRRAFWINGTAIAGTRQIGIYTTDGAQIYTTGAVTASGSASLPQYAAVATPFILYPGDYYFAFVTSSAANSCFGFVSTNALSRMCGIKGQATATLPAAATFATPGAAAPVLPLCGFTWTPSGF